MRRPLTFMRRFLSDQRGSALVFVAIMLPVLVGFALLAIDIARVNNLHNDLQAAVDAMALAGAAELDGTPDAITRANRAIETLVSNNYLFSTADGEVTLNGADGVTRRYLRSIPSHDWDAINDGEVTTDPGLAEYVEITATPVAFKTIFPVSLVGSVTGNLEISATAVAVNNGTTTCDMTPVFICDPFKNPDGTGPGFTSGVETEQFLGRSVALVTGGTTWGPGNFGFLRPKQSQGYGDSKLSADIARGSVQECVTSRHIYVSTGNMTTNDVAGFNTRFDIFPANGNGFPQKTDTSWPSGPNVRKGYALPTKNGNGNGNGNGVNACNAAPSTDTTNYYALPVDLAPDTSILGGKVGNGSWAYQTYLSANNLAAVKTSLEGDGITAPTRWQVWNRELDLSSGTPPNTGPVTVKSGPGGTGEDGLPHCAPSNTTMDRNRRLIFAAIVDCSDADNINSLKGSSGISLKAEGFGSFFLLQPVTNQVLTEAVDVSGRAGRGTMADFARDDVELVR